MDLRRHLLEAATLIGAAVLCALVSNGIASRERKLALIAVYPNARKVPVESADPLPIIAPPATTATATAASSTPSVAPVTTTAHAAPTAKVPGATTAATTAGSPASRPNAQAGPSAPPSANVLNRFQSHPDKPYIEIGYDDAAALHRAGALVLDARRTSFYEQGHIAGARPFSVWESDIDDKVRKLFDERGDPTQQAHPIVIYCSGGECEDSHMLSQKLWGIEFNNVYVYKDGYPDWMKHGGATHAGTKP